MTSNTEPRYPDASVQLVGEDGNAFFIIGRATKALRSAGASSAELADFQAEAMSGNYAHVLSTVQQWVTTS